MLILYRSFARVAHASAVNHYPRYTIRQPSSPSLNVRVTHECEGTQNSLQLVFMGLGCHAATSDWTILLLFVQSLAWQGLGFLRPCQALDIKFPVDAEAQRTNPSVYSPSDVILGG